MRAVHFKGHGLSRKCSVNKGIANRKFSWELHLTWFSRHEKHFINDGNHVIRIYWFGLLQDFSYLDKDLQKANAPLSILPDRILSPCFLEKESGLISRVLRLFASIPLLITGVMPPNHKSLFNQLHYHLLAVGYTKCVCCAISVFLC
jgi:hypothetical protein